MSRKKEFYSRRRPLRTALKIILITILILVIISVGLFFYLQRYVVYTADGVRLDLPFLSTAEPSNSLNVSSVPSE